LFGFDGWMMPNEQKYTDIEGQAQPLTRLASASWQSIKTKQKCCTGARTELSINLNLAVSNMPVTCEIYHDDRNRSIA